MTDFQESVAAHLPQLENAIDAVELAPRLLGADAPRSYLILFTSPVEARPFGGSRRQLRRVAGRRRATVRCCRGRRLPPATRCSATCRQLRTSHESVPPPGRPTPATTGTTVDGVIAMDPHVLASLIGYAGPIHVESFDVGIDRWYAAQFLLHDQYVLDPGAGVPPPDAMDEVAPQTLDALLAGTLPDPTTLARDLGPLAADRRLQMWSADPPAQQLLDQIGLSEAAPSARRSRGMGGRLEQRRRQPSRWLPRSGHLVSVHRRPDSGTATAQIRVRLTNNASPGEARADVIDNDPRAAPGTSRVYVSAYSSLVLGEATIDGAVLATESGTESGWNVYSQYVDIPPGDVVTLEFQLVGHVDRPGEVVTWQQPMAVETP